MLLKELAPEKPFAIAETGFTAEDVSITGLQIKGNVDLQNQYMQLMLERAQEEKAEFVILIAISKLPT